MSISCVGVWVYWCLGVHIKWVSKHTIVRQTEYVHCRGNQLTFASDGGAFGSVEGRPLTLAAIHGLAFDLRSNLLQVWGRLCGVYGVQHAFCGGFYNKRVATKYKLKSY